MPYRERHITGNEELDKYVSFSHIGVAPERSDPIGQEEIISVLNDKNFLAGINIQIARKPADWAYLQGQYSAFIGINLARRLDIPCIEYDESKREKPDLTANKQYILLRWQRKNTEEFEPRYELQAEVHISQRNYLITVPDKNYLSSNPNLAPGLVGLDQLASQVPFQMVAGDI